MHFCGISNISTCVAVARILFQPRQRGSTSTSFFGGKRFCCNWWYWELIMVIIWRYGASAGAVDSDVWYMLIDSTSDAVRVDVMQTDRLSTIRNTDCHVNLTQLPTSQPHRQHCSLTPSNVHWRRFYFQLTRVHSTSELSGRCAL